MTRLLVNGRSSALVLAGIVLLAVNLRPAAVAVGPVLAEVRDGLSMSAPAAGPAHVAAGARVRRLRRGGAAAGPPDRGAPGDPAGAGWRCVVGLATRPLVPDQLPFLALSMLALSGMAVANVLLPSLVKLHFPDRVGSVTALYTGAMAVGLTAALMLTVPISDAGGGWRIGLGRLGGAGRAGGAAVDLAGRPRPAAGRRAARRPPRSTWPAPGSGWAMVLFFGLQSMQAYAIFGWFAQLWRDAATPPPRPGSWSGSSRRPASRCRCGCRPRRPGARTSAGSCSR